MEEPAGSTRVDYEPRIAKHEGFLPRQETTRARIGSILDWIFDVPLAFLFERLLPFLLKRFLLIGVTAVVTLLVTLLLVSLAANHYPQLLRLLPVQVEDSHIGRLRWSYPPLAYRFHLVGTGPERRAGLLGLVKLPPVWYYDLGLVNLSTIDVSAVEIEIQYAGKGEVFVDVGGSHLRFPDGTSPNESEYLRLIRGNGTTKLIMPRLNSGQGSRISIAIRSKSKPGFDDVTISPRCAEGAFSEITPIQWNAIGWKN